MAPPRTFSGQALRAARRTTGLSQERLALAVGRSTFTVQSYELGRATPAANVLPALADAVGVTVDALFTAEAVAIDAAA